MKVDVTKQIMNLQGEPFQTGGIPCPQCGHIAEGAQTMTLRKAIVQATTIFGPEDKDGAEKFERYRLALQATDFDEPDWKPEELTLIRELIGRIYSPVIVGRCWEMLE